jgi:hypothetical protein
MIQATLTGVFFGYHELYKSRSFSDARNSLEDMERKEAMMLLFGQVI